MTDGYSPIYPAEIKGVNYEGLTKREYFAVMAMSSALGNSGLNEGVVRTAKEKSMSVQATVAGMSIEFADALIEALNKETK